MDNQPALISRQRFKSLYLDVPDHTLSGKNSQRSLGVNKPCRMVLSM